MKLTDRSKKLITLICIICFVGCAIYVGISGNNWFALIGLLIIAILMVFVPHWPFKFKGIMSIANPNIRLLAFIIFGILLLGGYYIALFCLDNPISAQNFIIPPVFIVLLVLFMIAKDKGWTSRLVDLIVGRETTEDRMYDLGMKTGRIYEEEEFEIINGQYEAENNPQGLGEQDD